MIGSDLSTSACETPQRRLRKALLKSIVSGALLGLILYGIVAWLSRDEQIATFSISPSRTLTGYAEGEFFYEPPGYIYFELKQWGQTRVPRRRFMGIGPERKPRQSFRLVTSGDDEIVALLLNNEVQMIHEFSSGFTWPGPYTNVSHSQWEMAELLLKKLRTANPDIFCPRQIRYRKELDRRQSD